MKSGEQVFEDQGHAMGAVDHVADAHPFIRLMCQMQRARRASDAVAAPADPVDVLLIIGARRSHLFQLPRQHPFDGGGG